MEKQNKQIKTQRVLRQRTKPRAEKLVLYNQQPARLQHECIFAFPVSSNGIFLQQSRFDCTRSKQSVASKEPKTPPPG